MITKINKKIIAFQNTYYYPLLVAVIVFVCHSLSADVIGYFLMAVLAVYTLIASDDTTKVIPLIIFGIFIISQKNSPYMGNSDYYKQTINIVLLSVLAACVVSAFVYRLIKSGERRFKSLKLIYGLVALCGAYFLGGLFYGDYNAGSLLIAGLFSFLILGLFYFFTTTVKWNRDSFNYICNIMTGAVLLIVCQLVFLYATNSALRETFNKGYILLGWGISNIIASTITVMLPFVLYQAAAKKNCAFYFLVATAGLFAVVYTLSRTSLLFCGICYVGAGIYSVILGNNKRLLRILYGSGLIITAVIAIVFFDKIKYSLTFFIESGVSDSGRFDLYKFGFKNWLKNPIFGTGLKYTSNDFPLNFWFLRYHNHWIQFLSSTGIVGLLAYLFHRFQTLWLIFKKPSKKSIFIFLSILMFICTSALDVTLFNPVALFVYSIVLVTLERNTELLSCGNNPVISLPV